MININYALIPRFELVYLYLENPRAKMLYMVPKEIIISDFNRMALELNILL